MITINPETYKLNGNGTTTAPNWICIDIETADAPQGIIEKRVSDFENNFTGKGNTKDKAKIEAQRQEGIERIRNKASLLDSSPIICIVAKTPQHAIVFNGMDANTYDIPGWLCVPAEDEKNMLSGFRGWLEMVATPETVFVGHNIRGFDLPKIRHAFIRNSLNLPECLTPGVGISAETADTMHLFKAFSMENRDNLFVSLDTVAKTLGIPTSKMGISGADVPVLHKAGKFKEILTYCALDCAVTARAFELMTGQVHGLL
ncbi:MAG: ribonuclease H-like domain-containing protein [Calditrichaeota bacterium]|nr:ribonuclease H-like domain-containing protein [Calditrichota bacterium]